MNNVILSIKKRIFIPSVCVIAVCFWLFLCKSHYESYWNGTIHRVQTVDFNILHHTLPPALSQLILAGHDQEIQQVLDSAFGIFGLVVTDAEGKEILFRTKAFYKKETWQGKVSLQYLAEQQEPYDLLTDPPPLITQYNHSSPRVDEASPSSMKNTGRVIGRVYYLRGVPPSFPEDLAGAIASNWFEMSGSKRGYILLTLIVIGFSLAFVYIVLWRKRVLQMQEKELVSRETELQVRRKALDHLNADIAAQRKRKEWLEQEAELAYQRALRIKDTLGSLKETLFVESSFQSKANQDVNVRPPLHKASALIGDVESVLPELTQNAKVLRSQAEVLQSYCAQLETRQAEMQKLLAQKASGTYQPSTFVSPDNPGTLGQGESAPKFS